VTELEIQAKRQNLTPKPQVRNSRRRSQGMRDERRCNRTREMIGLAFVTPARTRLTLINATNIDNGQINNLFIDVLIGEERRKIPLTGLGRSATGQRLWNGRSKPLRGNSEAEGDC
jgi:hypothetical protein